MAAHPSHAWTASWKPNSDTLVSHCGKCACLLSALEANRPCPCASTAGGSADNEVSATHPLQTNKLEYPNLHNKLKNLLKEDEEDDDEEDDNGDSNYRNRRRVMCTNFEQKGSCQFGSRCKFLHGEKDNRFERRKRHNSDRICTHFQKGDCRLGDQCKFIHQNEGLTTKRGPTLYRTQRVCTEYQLNKCEYGDKCKFKHT